ncbi:uracil-DNA glycosylase [Halobiforma lacisalsi AJ5]|uniref:Type-4 uracil-DNA glycosylase n=1 Tax=Natronobacterium lacisalsi AJ5 TaxID=358396 RepID=M0LRH2_NATLA|nr:uracil-DNA glycosylase [Halobiforma lacisalsi]APW96940.1 uracil-DNA glycosylase [Halobiforma lacisalsi AJ5]EMA34650.1 phage SPO1 DNA polymerase-like protein [Halobiforma lacisalsi AJ5]
MSDSDSSSGTDWEFTDVFADPLESVPDEQFDRERFVPAVGPLSAEVALIGEAPGAQEVQRGEPFAGQAGSQLDRALEAIGYDRRDCYITNLVKVRPPENRDPHVAEIEAWWPVLEAELERVDPAVVVPMGSFATAQLLETDETITDLHGREFEREGRTVVPAFHPAAALYDRSKVDAIESDLETALERA